MSPPVRKIRVLVVDDSALVRRVLADALRQDECIEIVGTAPDPVVARTMIAELKPDVLTLDIEMPRMDGLTFLRELMKTNPMPVVVISSIVQPSREASIEALRLGAVEVIAKPNGPYSVGDLTRTLSFKIRAAAAARIAGNKGITRGTAIPKATFATNSIIALGASTGGTEALMDLMVRLPANSPGIVVAQHIPAGFSRTFAERLNAHCAVEVREAADGDRLLPGIALLAPGGFHMVVQRIAQGYRVGVKDGPLVRYQKPAVDVLFQSVAKAARGPAAAALLTGMGSDGAEGMLQLRKAGAHTIAQDEATCVVFGMPKEAIKLGAASQVLPLHRIPGALLSALRAGDPVAPDRHGKSQALSEDVPAIP